MMNIKRSRGIEREIQMYNQFINENNAIRMSIFKKSIGDYIVDTSYINDPIEKLYKKNSNYTHEKYCVIKDVYYNGNVSKINPEKIEKIIEQDLKNVSLWKVEDIKNNPYFKNIKMPVEYKGKISYHYSSFKKNEVFGDYTSTVIEDFFTLPHIGIIDGEMDFPGFYENENCWMSITPNEISTMQEPINRATGHVLTFGLGLGYFTYMVSLKENVDSITVVEINETVTDFFKKHILPQFEHKEKVKIITADALQYVKTIKDEQYDYIFADTWQNQYDGLSQYFEYKKSANKLNIPFDYWIEQSLLEELRDNCWAYFLSQFYQYPLSSDYHNLAFAKELLFNYSVKSKKDIWKLLSFNELKKKINKLK